MNEQERQVIEDIFQRLSQVADQPREAEAERFIAEKLRQQPYAPYAMAQAIYIQEQTIAALTAELEDARSALAARETEARSGGFLGSLFGARRPEPSSWQQERSFQGDRGWQGRQARHPEAEFQGGARINPWARGQAAPGGFLQGALSTAAGVAGGMMVANALSHVFGGEAAKPSSSASPLHGASGSEPEAANDRASLSDGLYKEPQPQQDDFDPDVGFDGGGDGDWA